MNTLTTLISLYKVVEAGEKGYAVAASNASNRALRILFQSNSQQRRVFKNEIFAEIQKLKAHQAKPRDSLLAMIHRGRINIFAYLTIGEENVEKVLLKEVILGERAALRAYERTLQEDLPAEIRVLVERQFQNVREVVDQVRMVLGQNKKRLVLRLYDTKKDAEQASQSLKEAGIPAEAITIDAFQPPVLEPSKDPPTTLLETVLSGAVGGQFWGVVTAILVALTILQIAIAYKTQVSLGVILFAMFALMAQGALVGGVIGLFIGWGVTSQDRYVVETVKKGEVLLQALVHQSLASNAWKVMNQVAMTARAQHASEATV